MALFKLEVKQELHTSMQEVWDFISSPLNLKDITPPYMGFEVLSKNLPDKMYPGMMIEYTVKPVLGIKLKWLTEITHVDELKFFVDEQRYGPYTLWHHQHHIQETPNGVLMTDLVHYIPPYGVLGTIANSVFIKKQLNTIFEFRRLTLEKRFPQSI